LYSIASENHVHQFSAILEPLETHYTIPSTTETKLVFDQSCQILFPENAFAYENNGPYSGKVKVYFQKSGNELLGALVLNKKFDYQVFSSAQIFQLEAFTENEERLKLIKPIFLVSDPGLISASIPFQHDSWTENNKQIIDGQYYEIINYLGPIAMGRLTEYKVITTSVKTTSGLPVSLSVCKLSYNQIDRSVQPDQNGKAIIYAPVDSEIILKVQDRCGQTYTSANLTKGKNDQHLDLFIEPLFIISPISVLDGCEETEIGLEDLINIRLISNYGKQLLYQDKANSIFNLLICENIKRISYYFGNSFKYAFNFYDNNWTLSNNYILRNEFFCLPKINGYYMVDGQYVYIDKNQLYILLDDMNNLTITDFSNFAISILNVTSKGIFQAESVYIFNPKFISCENNSCSNIEINIKKFEGKDQPAKIEFSGKIEDHMIEGCFEGVIK